MRLTLYSRIYPSPEDSDSVVLFSTKKMSAVLVPANLINEIESNNLSADEKETLADLGFLVENREQELNELTEYIKELNSLDHSHRFILVMSLDCNLNCSYCFEGTRKGKHVLSEEIANRFVEFVKSRNYSSKEDIRITYYGGEPLLSIDRIAIISEKIRDFAAEKGLKYGFSLVTNGTLLTPAIAKRLVPLGLESAKVTLDGPQEIHDRLRPFTSGTGSFDVIMRNIRDVCGMIRIQVGGNYTRDNYKEFPRLLDDLMSQGLTPEKIAAIKFDPVVNETNEFAPPDFHDGCESINEPWISEAGLFLREEILCRGYHTQKVMPSLCFMQINDNFVVNYDGALYKCPGLIGREQCRVGDLGRGVTDYRESHNLDAWKNEECLACAYLPLCFGGCKYMKLLRYGSMAGINCQKEYLDRTLGELVRQDIQYGL